MATVLKSKKPYYACMHLYIQKEGLQKILVGRQDRVRVVVRTGNHDNENV